VELPVRIAGETSPEPVISVDGAWGAPGLNLSHWPGNATPRELRHDLSTGVALAFSALGIERRRELARGCVAIENNHFDTDGTCALFAVRHPELALPRRDALLEAAAAGDLFRHPSDRALAVGAVVEVYADPERSPIAAELAGLGDSGRFERATHALFAILPALFDGDLEPWRELWQPIVDATRAGRAALARAERDDLVHLDWTVWRAERPLDAEPGRHALFGSTDADRVLVSAPRDGGCTHRFVLNTTSWFDLVTRSAQPRPDLAALAARLNELEGSDPGREAAWRAQATDSPSPELWFGSADHERFAEHCPALRPSRLAPAAVRREIAEALRAALALSLPA
jgi:hypothetical protein